MVFSVAIGVLVAAPVARADSASGGVVVSAIVAPTILLDITTPGPADTVDFGAVEPGVITAPQAVGVQVSSNRPWSLSKSLQGAALLGLATTLTDSAGNPRTNATVFTDGYTLEPPETTSPGTYSAAVQYTVVQE
jgi:hypothetical protein